MENVTVAAGSVSSIISSILSIGLPAATALFAVWLTNGAAERREASRRLFEESQADRRGKEASEQATRIEFYRRNLDALERFIGAITKIDEESTAMVSAATGADHATWVRAYEATAGIQLGTTLSTMYFRHEISESWDAFTSAYKAFRPAVVSLRIKSQEYFRASQREVEDDATIAARAAKEESNEKAFELFGDLLKAERAVLAECERVASRIRTEALGTNLKPTI